MITNYILVDYQSVQPKGLDGLPDSEAALYRVIVFRGAEQQQVEGDLMPALERTNIQVQGVKSGGDKGGCLIAYYLGRLVMRDPEGLYYIISKSLAYDAMVAHLQETGVQISRHSRLSGIPGYTLAEAEETALDEAEPGTDDVEFEAVPADPHSEEAAEAGREDTEFPDDMEFEAESAEEEGPEEAELTATLGGEGDQQAWEEEPEEGEATAEEDEDLISTQELLADADEVLSPEEIFSDEGQAEQVSETPRKSAETAQERSKDASVRPKTSRARSRKSRSKAPRARGIQAASHKTASIDSGQEEARLALITEAILDSDTRPRKWEKLKLAIKDLFKGELKREELAGLLRELQKREYIIVDRDQVTYPESQF